MTSFAVKQSTLNAIGYGYVDFPSLTWSQRRDLASLALRAQGQEQAAMLLELNNPLACNSIVYIRDSQNLVASNA